MHIISCNLKKSIFEINHLHIFIFGGVFAKLCTNWLSENTHIYKRYMWPKNVNKKR